ncbi:hypothetical protein QQ008_12150 [Fulvivirgaceae bacterium BMA10]|uniref:Twin-arginine translocation signal domain-containing protein n=1 Tax=Splendidivirga corallicola TaxID=3051826 RepID=A0ABT8KN29_9BACT|nr:hypothetical protein [Fulvivirgaceae bacterium BMA10]
MKKNNVKKSRRKFIKQTTLSSAALAVMPLNISANENAELSQLTVLDDFKRPDSLYHGHDWETLNPGYWQVQSNALRRRLKNVGDRARRTGFPYHYETHRIKGKSEGVMDVEYDPSLPLGIIWNRNRKMRGDYTLSIEGKIHALSPSKAKEDDKPAQRQ